METGRLGLPMLSAGQLAKEVTVNEALALMDIATGALVETIGANTPPPTPTVGEAYVIGAAPTGAWGGQPHALAGYTVGGWRFIAPVAGLTVIDRQSGQSAVCDGTGWTLGEVRATAIKIAGTKVLGMQGSAVADPSGGTTVDVQARAALSAILDRLRVHGLIAS